MYPVTLGFENAKSRIEALLENGHCAEALLTTVFTFEKVIHRTLKQLIVSSGFRNADAEMLMKHFQGFRKQAEIWSCFDPSGQKVVDVISSKNWQFVHDAVKMRNQLVHGARVYDLEACSLMARNILALLDDTVKSFNEKYGFDGWSKVSVRRRSNLHTDPKVVLK